MTVLQNTKLYGGVKQMRKNKNSVIAWFERNLEIITNFANVITAGILVAQIIFDLSEQNIVWCIILSIAASISAILILWVLVKHIGDKPKYDYLVKKRQVSEAVLRAYNQINQTKKRYILQSTYGNVPEWHPTDYTKNVLVYDVHGANSVDPD